MITWNLPKKYKSTAGKTTAAKNRNTKGNSRAGSYTGRTAGGLFGRRALPAGGCTRTGENADR
jgi:hypothetical protein